MVVELLVLTVAVAQMAAPAFSAFTGKGVGIAERATQGRVSPVSPADWAFLIWALIYPACLVFGVYQLFPAADAGPAQEVRLYMMSAFAANTVWALLAQLTPNRLLWTTIPTIVWMLASLLAALVALTGGSGAWSVQDNFFVVAPVSIFAGWITVATFANLAVLEAAGFRQFGLGDQVWALLVIGTASLLSALFVWLSDGNPWYTLTLLWAVVGIVWRDVTLGRFPTALLAGCACLVILGVAASRWSPAPNIWRGHLMMQFVATPLEAGTAPRHFA